MTTGIRVKRSYKF